MTSKKILVVLGATGNQGGSVIDTILSDITLSKEFDIRAVTRDPTKLNAAALATRGVSLFKADLEDKNSLRLALRDAHTVFAITKWRELLDKEREIQQGKNIADVAKELDVKHFIWSSSPDNSKITSGKITGVLHFESKVVVQAYIASLGIPATYLQLAIFFEFIPPLLIPVGPKTYTFMFPMPLNCKIPLISVKKDTGTYVRDIIINREKLIGNTIAAGEGEYSLLEVVDIVAKAGGLTVNPIEVTDEQYRGAMAADGMPPHVVDDMALMMQFIKEYGFYGEEVVATGHSILSAPLTTFEQWIASSEQIAAMK